MTADPLSHLTLAQLVAAEDYAGCSLDRFDTVPVGRRFVITAWALLLRDDPTAPLEQATGLTRGEFEALAEKYRPDVGEV